MMARYLHPINPIVFKDSDTLILGSFPSLKSFEQGFYYAHPKNQFWPLLSTIYKMRADSKEDRIALLEYAKIALWDVIASCERTNSADSNLKNAVSNDIEGLLAKHPSIQRIFFTGKTAEKLYKKHFAHLSVPTALLPSPSPAYAAMRFEGKLEIWGKLFFDSVK
jgi:TDG/mug DNA glycosylase family protein